MAKILFRVECNNGSKYFDNSFEAICFLQFKKRTAYGECPTVEIHNAYYTRINFAG